MITRTVNIHATYDDGTIAANALVVAVLSHADLDPSDGWISPQNVTAVTDSNGDASIELWPDERGQHGSQYRVSCIDQSGNYVFDVWANVPDSEPHQLADISEPVEPGQGQVGGTLTTDQVKQLINDKLGDHTSATDPHPQYGTGGAQDTHSGRADNPHGVTAAQAGADPAGSASQALADAKGYTDDHEGRADNPHQVTAGQVGADPAGTATSEVDSHEAATDPHPQYGTGGAQDTHSGRTNNPHNVTAGQAGADPAGTAASEVSDHENEADPHPQYGTGGAQDTHSGRTDNPHQVTAAQVGADADGDADQAVNDHEAKTDPHTQYAERSENLADLDSASSARSNLGLGSAAEKDTGTGPDQLPTNTQVRGVNWFEVSGNMTLDSSHYGMTAWVTADAEILLPLWSNVDPTYGIEVAFAGNYALNVDTQGSDSVLNSKSSIATNAVIAITPVNGQWGIWASDDALLAGDDVSLLANDAGFLAVGDNNSQLNNDANYQTPSDVRTSVKEETGTSYTYSLSDENTFIQHNNSSSITATVPPNSSVAFPVGTIITGEQAGAGQVTIAEGSGVTIHSENGLKTNAQYAQYSLIKVATDEWRASGGLTA